METVVIVTAAIGRPSSAVRAARAVGFRATLRDLRGALDDVALDGPGVIVLDVPPDYALEEGLESLTAVPDLDSVPILAIVSGSQLSRVGHRGLTDFCVQPLDEAELGARLLRLVRRPGRDDADRIVVGDLVVDLRGYQAELGGDPLDLTYQEFQLAAFLASHPGQAFSRDQLLARVWGHDYYGGSRTVDIHVRRIRAKLGPAYARCIQTIRHVGYKWAPPGASEETG